MIIIVFFNICSSFVLECESLVAIRWLGYTFLLDPLVVHVATGLHRLGAAQRRSPGWYHSDGGLGAFAHKR